MKVSVIVPVYKVEQYLPKCLDSLVSQTIDDYEVILINDGSPDNSQEIIDAYRAKYPDIIRSVIVENGGQGRARNFGIDMAQGEYIGFVDSDDWVDVAMFERLYAAAAAENADIVLCDCVAVSVDGTREYMDTSACVDPLRVSGSVWNKLFRRGFIGDVRFPSGLWYEDFDFTIKLILASSKNVSVPEGLYFYRVSPGSTMRNNNARKNLDIITVAEDVRSYMEKNGFDTGFETIVLDHILLDSINRVEMQNAPDKSEVIKTLRSYVHTHIPSLSECPTFGEEKMTRRIIMRLNYLGLEKMSGLLLKLKKLL